MSESNPIERALNTTGRPATRESLAAELRELGVSDGGVLCVHSSLSALGWVVGGAQAVIDALIDAVGADGTLVMPAHTAGNSDPSNWTNPPVPEEWWQTIRDHMPAYDRAKSPTRALGTIPEAFRAYPGVRRSAHPSFSFCARGPRAEDILSNHSIEHGVGEDSPLARLYDMTADVLLLGVGYGSCSILHLSEYRAEYADKAEIDAGAAVLVDGRREWVEFRDLHSVWDEQFDDIGASFETLLDVEPGRVACADARLVRSNLLVDFGVGWIESRSVSDRTAALRAERDAFMENQ